MRIRYCKYCGKELIDTSYFCDIDCENTFRNENQELYVKYNKGTYDWFCPLADFVETDTELIFYIGGTLYILIKNDIDEWKIDKCSCLQEFTEVNVKCFE